MKTYDLREFIDGIESVIETHQLGEPGAYRRWNVQNDAGSRDLALNPYGCADAANLLYTIGRFPHDPAARAAWVATLQSLQDVGDGLFHEATHHPIHTTAHCIAALELFDAGPAHPVKALLDYADSDAMEAFLDGLDWTVNPWSASHQGAGLYVSLVLTGEVPLEWQDRYFGWLWAQTDPATGFLRVGYVEPVSSGETFSLFPHLAGTFHYLFNHQYARRPHHYAAAMIDSALEIWEDGSFPLGNAVGFAEIDWVFCITRSLYQTGHRYADCIGALRAFEDKFVPYLLSLHMGSHDAINDLHSLFGASCALAELQRWLPGTIRTEAPLKLVLDRRPFI